MVEFQRETPSALEQRSVKTWAVIQSPGYSDEINSSSVKLDYVVFVIKVRFLVIVVIVITSCLTGRNVSTAPFPPSLSLPPRSSCRWILKS